MPDEPELLDMLMADGFVLSVFMLEISLRLARKESDSQAWARDFMSKLHARVDSNEERMGDSAMNYPVHELARQRLDILGTHLVQLLHDHPHK